MPGSSPKPSTPQGNDPDAIMDSSPGTTPISELVHTPVPELNQVTEDTLNSNIQDIQPEPPALPPRPPNLSHPGSGASGSNGSSRPNSSNGSNGRTQPLIANSYSRAARLENEGRNVSPICNGSDKNVKKWFDLHCILLTIMQGLGWKE